MAKSRELTEAKWHAAKLVAPLLYHLADAAPLSDRKLRLFGCACCRRQWAHLTDPRSRAAVEVAERLAEGRAKRTEQTRAAKAAWGTARAIAEAKGYDFDWELRKLHIGFNRGRAPGFRWAVAAGFALGDRASTAADGAEGVSNLKELAAGCAVLRDIAGDPFRPVAFDPAWRTDTAVALAKGMYEARDFAAMPVLADALQDAGCEDEQVLAHCRTEAEHARGCWVVDGVLGLS